MKELLKKAGAVLAIMAALPLVLTGMVFATSLHADGKQPEKVTICHANSGVKGYTRNVVSENAIGGHFDNPGSPKAGHEDDILLQGDVPCPTVNEDPEEPNEPEEEPETPATPTNPSTPGSTTTTAVEEPVVEFQGK